ncbi:MAG TPA: four helix bundle protein [Chthoniobacterales bacterium]|nr:four helix bundle protein [Chthoniobacterales bacterium]
MKRESLNRESRIVKPAEHNAKRQTASTFEDLEVYQLAREFRKAMYCVATGLREIENFGLALQMRRAGLSLTNNIAEGHGRYYYLDQIKFMLQSRGSPEELIDDLNTCDDESYLPSVRIADLKQNGWRVRQLIDGYIRYLREQKRTGTISSVAEFSPRYGDRETIDDDSRSAM